jgi:hypothetical protein
MVEYKIIKKLGSGYFRSVFEAVYQSQRACLQKVNFNDEKSFQIAQQEVLI